MEYDRCCDDDIGDYNGGRWASGWRWWWAAVLDQHPRTNHRQLRRPTIIIIYNCFYNYYYYYSVFASSPGIILHTNLISLYIKINPLEMLTTPRLSFSVLTVLSLLVVGCLCRPQDAGNGKPARDGGVKPLESATGPTNPFNNRNSRLQKPTQGKISHTKRNVRTSKGIKTIFRLSSNLSRPLITR